MTRATKLYIYDKSDWIDRAQANGRFIDDDDVLTIGVGLGVQNLRKVFENLAANELRFNRVLFQTHGGPGSIWFGNEPVTANVLKTQFTGFSKLFPHPTRIYFDGCNVAEGGAGTNFLLAAGEVFLILGGGETVGWTTIGHGIPGLVSLIGAIHCILVIATHLRGYVSFAAGAQIFQIPGFRDDIWFDGAQGGADLSPRPSFV
jgi:hypothetical protein